MRVSLLALLATAAGWSLARARQPHRASSTGRAKSLQESRSRIKGVSGDIRAVASSGDVEVTAAKHARRSDPDDVKIEVVEHEDGVTICAVYPATIAGRTRAMQAVAVT